MTGDSCFGRTGQQLNHGKKRILKTAFSTILLRLEKKETYEKEKRVRPGRKKKYTLGERVLRNGRDFLNNSEKWEQEGNLREAL